MSEKNKIRFEMIMNAIGTIAVAIGAIGFSIMKVRAAADEAEFLAENYNADWVINGGVEDGEQSEEHE